ncbi:hypothetical protein D3C87_1808710 [compost metagenome]
MRSRVPSSRSCRNCPSGSNQDQMKIVKGAATMNMSTDGQPVRLAAPHTTAAPASTSGQTKT